MHITLKVEATVDFALKRDELKDEFMKFLEPKVRNEK